MKHTIRIPLAIVAILLTASGFTLGLANLPAFAPTASTDTGSRLIAQNSRPQRPPEEALKACSGKQSGASCSFKAKDSTVKGTCQSPASNVPAACMPAGGAPKS